MPELDLPDVDAGSWAKYQADQLGEYAQQKLAPQPAVETPAVETPAVEQPVSEPAPEPAPEPVKVPDWVPDYAKNALATGKIGTLPAQATSRPLQRNGVYYRDPDFEQNISRYGSEIAKQLGPQAGEFAIAQARLETGNGANLSTPFNYGNVGNTDENPKGGGRYSGPEEAAQAWVRFITNNGRDQPGANRYNAFTTAAKNGADLGTLAQLIKNAGYATDPNYVSKLMAIARKNPSPDLSNVAADLPPVDQQSYADQQQEVLQDYAGQKAAQPAAEPAKSPVPFVDFVKDKIAGFIQNLQQTDLAQGAANPANSADTVQGAVTSLPGTVGEARGQGWRGLGATLGAVGNVLHTGAEAIGGNLQQGIETPEEVAGRNAEQVGREEGAPLTSAVEAAATMLPPADVLRLGRAGTEAFSAADAAARLRNAVPNVVQDVGDTVQAARDARLAKNLADVRADLTPEAIAQAKELGIDATDPVIQEHMARWRGALQARGEAVGSGPGAMATPPAGGGTGFISPERQATLDMLAGKDATPWQERLGASVSNAMDELERQMSTDRAEINRVTGRVRDLRGGSLSDDLNAADHFRNLAGAGGAAEQVIREGIQPAIDSVGNDALHLAELRKYQRDIEVMAAKGPGRLVSGGVKDIADAQQRIADIEAQVGPQRWAAIQAADAHIQDTLNALRTRLATAGLMDPDTAAMLEQSMPHYNPTRYLLDTGTAGSKTTRVAPTLRRLSETGLASDTENPLVSAASAVQAGEVAIRQNEANKALVNAVSALARDEAAKAYDATIKAGGKALDAGLAAKNAAEALIKKQPGIRLATGPEVGGAKGDVATIIQRKFGNEPNTVVTWVKGKPVTHSIQPKLYQAVRPVDVGDHEIFGKVMDAFDALNAPLRAGATRYSPSFAMFNNPVRDAFFAWFKEGVSPAQIARGAVQAAKESPEYERRVAAGGLMPGYVMRSPDAIKAQILKNGGIPLTTARERFNMVRDALGYLPSRLERAGEVLEQGTRQAIFNKYTEGRQSPFERLFGGGPAGPQSDLVATAKSRIGTVDFSEAGVTGRLLNRMIVFTNPRIQGTLNFGKGLRDSPASRARLAAFGAAMGGLYAYNRTYPEYSDVSSYAKLTGAVIMLPNSTPGNPRYIWLPLGELAVPKDALEGLLSKAADKNPANFGDFFNAAAQTSSPIPGEEAMLPGAFRPIEENRTNSKFGGGQVVPVGLARQPLPEQYNERTSQLAKVAGAKFNKSPLMIDNLIQGTTGGAGRAITGAADFLGGDKPINPDTIGYPAYRQQGGQDQQDFYRRLNDAAARADDATEKAVATYKADGQWQALSPGQQQQVLVKIKDAMLHVEWAKAFGVKEDPATIMAKVRTAVSREPGLAPYDRLKREADLERQLREVLQPVR